MARILIPTDLSDSALNAAEYGIQLFGEKDNTFTLLHTIPEPIPADPIMVSAAPIAMSTATEGMRIWEKRFRKLLNDPEGHVETFYNFGSSASQLDRLTMDRRYSAVVLGVPVDDEPWWFGAGAGEMVKASHVPVVAVPPRVGFAPIRRMLLADDGGDAHPSALAFARDLAVAQGAEVIAVRVLKEEEPDVQPDGAPAQNVLFSGMPHTFLTVRSDDVVSALEREAERLDADMVVLLHRHLGLLAELFHTSTAKKLALHTSIPLLVLQQG